MAYLAALLRDRRSPHRQRVKLRSRSEDRRSSRNGSTPCARRGSGSRVHPGSPGALVACDPFPRDQQRRLVTDQVEQIVEPADRIGAGPTMQLALMIKYSLLGRNTDSGHDASLFSSVLPVVPAVRKHAAVLPPVTGFPGLGVLRRLRHDPRPTAGVTPAPQSGVAARSGEGGPGRFPRSQESAPTGSAPGYTPAVSPDQQIAVLGGASRLPMGSGQTERDRPSVTAVPAPQSGPSTGFRRPLTTHGTSIARSDVLAPVRHR